MTGPTTPSQFHAAKDVEDWCLISKDPIAFFRTSLFAESGRFIQAIGKLEEAEDHRPGVDVRSELL